MNTHKKLFMDGVIESIAILELFACEDQTLLP